MIIGVPSGIGDISWAYSKLCHVGQLDYEIATGWPFRADEYMKMLPGVRVVMYGDFSFDEIVAFEQVQLKIGNGMVTWQAVKDSGYGRVLLQPNHHLERGIPLQRWMPDLETDYHYPMNIPQTAVATAESLLFGVPRRETLVGISCASYRGAKAWKTWELLEWTDFCKTLLAEGFGLIFLGGRWDDLTDAVALEFTEWPNLVGKTSFATACALHQMVPWYVGFSSGLGIIRTVLRQNCMMLWPEHQQPLSTSWADPEDLETRRYVVSPYVALNTVTKIFLRHAKETQNGE
jgi:hypothetical protein